MDTKVLTMLATIRALGASAAIAGRSIESCPYIDHHGEGDYLKSPAMKRQTWRSGYMQAVRANVLFSVGFLGKVA